MGFMSGLLEDNLNFRCSVFTLEPYVQMPMHPSGSSLAVSSADFLCSFFVFYTGSHCVALEPGWPSTHRLTSAASPVFAFELTYQNIILKFF